MSEKDWIKRYFAPLSTPGARNMTDDAGLLSAPGSWQIATTDAMVEGVHFLAGQDLGSVAKKLVRVNVSDLLAKGARPAEALLTLGWPKGRGEDALNQFSEALAEEFSNWEIGLVGGDTVSAPQLFVSLTLIGAPSVPEGAPIWQSGAKPGDEVLLTGRIGGNIGLIHAQAGRNSPAAAHYHTPEIPPLEAACLVSQFANAATDVSDGLFADLANLLTQSGTGAEISLEAITYWDKSCNISDLLAQCSAGDDYQIVCTSAPENAAKLRASGIFYKIGQVVVSPGLAISLHGERVNLPETLGFEHGKIAIP